MSMDFLSGQAGNVDRPAYKGYPLLQWYNGNESLRQAYGNDDIRVTGGFVFKASQDDQFPLGERITWQYQGGHTEDVFAIGGMLLAPIVSQLHWFIDGEDKRRVWLKEYSEGAKGRNRWLVYCPDLHDWHEENGLLMISAYGMAGKFLGQTFKRFQNEVVREIEKASGIDEELDSYTFAVPIVADKSQKASEKWTTMITPPTLMETYGGLDLLADDPVAVGNSLYIQPEGMELCASKWDEAVEWRDWSPSGDFNSDHLIPDEDNDTATEEANERDW